MDAPQDLPQGWRRVDGYERYDGRPAFSNFNGGVVPGAGPIHYLAVYGETLYALRDNENRSEPVLWRLEDGRFVIAKQGE